MVRRYGKAPYKIVLVHGGPGAIGSLKGFAQELNERSGIIAVIKYFWPGIPGGMVGSAFCREISGMDRTYHFDRQCAA